MEGQARTRGGKFSPAELEQIPKIVADGVQWCREGLISGSAAEVDTFLPRAYWRLRGLLNAARLFGGHVPALPYLTVDDREAGTLWAFAPVTHDDALAACDALATWAADKLPRSMANTDEVAASQKLRAIAPENRTKPMSYRKAAVHIGKSSGERKQARKDAAKWLRKCVVDGTYACEHITRQTHVFNKNDFPESAWKSIMPS